MVLHEPTPFTSIFWSWFVLGTGCYRVSFCLALLYYVYSVLASILTSSWKGNAIEFHFLPQTPYGMWAVDVPRSHSRKIRTHLGKRRLVYLLVNNMFVKAVCLLLSALCLFCYCCITAAICMIVVPNGFRRLHLSLTLTIDRLMFSVILWNMCP